jgi:hypothetical protein
MHGSVAVPIGLLAGVPRDPRPQAREPPQDRLAGDLLIVGACDDDARAPAMSWIEERRLFSRTSFLTIAVRVFRGRAVIVVASGSAPSLPKSIRPRRSWTSRPPG